MSRWTGFMFVRPTHGTVLLAASESCNGKFGENPRDTSSHVQV
jgi:hypothetical protein